MSDTAGVGTTEKFVDENHWNLVSILHRTRHTSGVIYPHVKLKWLNS